LLERRRLLTFLAVGPEFRINSATLDAQFAPAVAIDADGNFVVAWSNYGLTSSDREVHAQRYDSSGVRQGAEFQVNSHTAGDPAVAMDATGNFVVVWLSTGQDGSGSGIYGQLYDATGSPRGTEFRANAYTTNDQKDPAVAMDDDGDFVVAWTSAFQGTLGLGVHGQRYGRLGVPQGPEFRINTYTTDWHSVPSIGIAPGGDFVVAWVSSGQDGSADGIYAKRYNSDGGQQSEEFRVNTYTTGSQAHPSVGMRADGSFVVAWRLAVSGESVWDVHAQSYDSNGVIQGEEFRVNSYTTFGQHSPAVAVDPRGEIIISWQSMAQDGSGYGVYARRYSASGISLAPEFRVNTYTTNHQASPSVAINTNGNCAVVWSSLGQDGSSDGVYAQLYLALDSVPPTVQSSRFQYSEWQALELSFSEPLDAVTVNATDLSAINLDDGTAPIANRVFLTSGNTVATWIFNTAGTFINDGDYRFTLPRNVVADLAGNPLELDYNVIGKGIYFLAADANRDRRVNLADFNVLAGHFGQSNQTFAQGDFNYDRVVNLADFNILAGRFGTILSAPSAATISTFGQSLIDDSDDEDAHNDLLA
jgi:hypothetical protein